jgi:hypothetical protein
MPGSVSPRPRVSPPSRWAAMPAGRRRAGTICWPRPTLSGRLGPGRQPADLRCGQASGSGQAGACAVRGSGGRLSRRGGQCLPAGRGRSGGRA